MKITVLFICFLYCFKTVYGQTNCAIENSIRLNPVGIYSRIRSAGRLEICYCINNICTWSTISTGSYSTPWSWKNVQVACRELSFGGLGNPILNSPSSTLASDSINFYPSTFDCDGTESNITDCTTSPLILPLHQFDVFIYCSSVTLNSVRLTGTTTRHQGVVEVRRTQGSQGIWETVCTDVFGSNEANIVCKSIGYESGRTNMYSINQFHGSQINTTNRTHIRCTGSEINIKSCSFITTGCSVSNLTVAGVICLPSSSPDGSTRLFTDKPRPRVEVLYSNRWGTICDTQWEINDAAVICNAFDRGTATSFPPTTIQRIEGSFRTIWASSYHCSGNENNLNSCSRAFPIGYAPNCQHSYDVHTSCTNDQESVGLSGGAIVGIVFAVAVIVFFIIPIIFAYGKSACKKGRIRRWWSRSTTRHSETTVTPTTNRNNATREEGISLREVNVPTVETSNVDQDLSNSELTNAPPPSYNDALLFDNVHSPPKYEPSFDPSLPEYPN